MKSTGIVRKIDELGRIVIPMELRRVLQINIKDSIEIFTEDDAIILRKYVSQNSCLVSGEVSDNNLVLADGKLVLSRPAASELLKELQNIVNKGA